MRILTLLLLLICQPLHAQGFAGLGAEANGFATPERGTPILFPKDHGAHPNYRIEWWYLTALLEAADGTPFGAQWTLFRSALGPRSQSGWDSGQLWMAHAAVTSADAHFVAERLARGGVGQASVEVDKAFQAYVDDWAMTGTRDLDALQVTAAGVDFRYDFELTAQGPMIFQGDAGYSVKSAAGQASYYYSQPFFAVSGTLHLPAGNIPVTGTAWLDREWSSQPLADTQTGWDWFSLSFDDGSRMMGFQLRSQDGAPFTAATWITAEGQTTPYPDGAFRAEPIEYSDVADRNIPTTWRLSLPAQNLDITISALNEASWMTTSVPYWEGPIVIDGSHSGRGYLEMTGY